MVEQFIQTVFSEYGAFFVFLLIVIGSLVAALKNLWKVNVTLDARLDAMSGKFLLALENNTKVITQLVERIGRHDE